MRLRPATAPRGQALVLRRWIVIASRARVNIRVCLERLSRHVGAPVPSGRAARFVSVGRAVTRQRQINVRAALGLFIYLFYCVFAAMK